MSSQLWVRWEKCCAAELLLQLNRSWISFGPSEENAHLLVVSWRGDWRGGALLRRLKWRMSIAVRQRGDLGRSTVGLIAVICQDLRRCDS